MFLQFGDGMRSDNATHRWRIDDIHFVFPICNFHKLYLQVHQSITIEHPQQRDIVLQPTSLLCCFRKTHLFAKFLFNTWISSICVLLSFEIWKLWMQYGYMYRIYIYKTFVYMYVCARLQNSYHGFFYVTHSPNLSLERGLKSRPCCQCRTRRAEVSGGCSETTSRWVCSPGSLKEFGETLARKRLEVQHLIVGTGFFRILFKNDFLQYYLSPVVLDFVEGGQGKESAK